MLSLISQSYRHIGKNHKIFYIAIFLLCFLGISCNKSGLQEPDEKTANRWKSICEDEDAFSLKSSTTDLMFVFFSYFNYNQQIDIPSLVIFKDPSNRNPIFDRENPKDRLPMLYIGFNFEEPYAEICYSTRADDPWEGNPFIYAAFSTKYNKNIIVNFYRSFMFDYAFIYRKFFLLSEFPWKRFPIPKVKNTVDLEDIPVMSETLVDESTLAEVKKSFAKKPEKADFIHIPSGNGYIVAFSQDLFFKIYPSEDDQRIMITGISQGKIFFDGEYTKNEYHTRYQAKDSLLQTRYETNTNQCSIIFSNSEGVFESDWQLSDFKKTFTMPGIEILPEK